MSVMRTARKAGKTIKRAVFSKTVLALLMLAVSAAITVVYSLWDVSWDPNRIDWGRLGWNMGLLIGLFLIGIFGGWMLEAQSLRDDPESGFCLAKREYADIHQQIEPKTQYFPQFYLWERADEINGIKEQKLIDAGWRMTGSVPEPGKVLNASAHDIACYATAEDIDAAAACDKAVKVDRDERHVFYIAKIGDKLAKETKAIILEKESIEFDPPSYFLTDTDFSASKGLPELAQGAYERKKNDKKAVWGVVSSVLLMAAWAALIGGAVVDSYYGGSASAWINTLSRISSLLGGTLRGLGIVDSYYDGLANLLKKKSNVLHKFKNVMVDGNFVPDTRTETAQQVYERAMAEEREAEAKRQKALADARAEREASEAKREEYEARQAEEMAKQASQPEAKPSNVSQDVSLTDLLDTTK